jgi:hypothetical protein
MKEEEVLPKTPKISIIPRSLIAKEDFGKYKEPSEDVRVDLTINQLQVKLSSLVKQVTSLSLLLGNLAQVDWLQNWGAFRFDGMTDEHIEVAKNTITVWVRGLLAEQDALTGTYHTITFNWVEINPITYSLEAYLNPPAMVGPALPGSGQSVVIPTPPKQPPPPTP